MAPAVFLTAPGRSRLSDLQPGFGGGLNDVSDPFELLPNQLQRANNCRLTTYGAVKKRGGTQRATTAAFAAAVRGGFCWRRAATQEHIAVANGTFYSGGSTWAIPMTYTAKAMSGGAAAISSTARISFAAFRDGVGEVLYLADGGQLIKWDGTTLSRVAAGPSSVARLAVYNQRLIAVSGSDQTVYWSGLNNGDTLNQSGSGGGSAVVRTFGNQKLMTVATLRDSIALGHVTGISRFAGVTQDDIAIAAGVYGFSNDVGVPMPSSVVVVDGVAFFLTERGAYMMNDSGVFSLDRPEEKKPDVTAALLVALNSADHPSVTGVHDRAKREVRWFIPGAGVYCYNYRLGSWTGPWTGTYQQSDLVQWDAIDNDGDPIVCIGAGDGYVRQCDVSTVKDEVLSDGTGGDAFSFVATCRRMFTEAPEHDKAYRWAWLQGNLRGSGQAVVSWSTEQGSDSFTLTAVSPGPQWGTYTGNRAMIWGSFVWGGSTSRGYRIPLGGRGNYIDLSFTDGGTVLSEVSRMTLEAFDLGPRG